jgi:hypothetical protein
MFGSLLALGFGNARGAGPDFNREVRPILSDKCYHCHGPDEERRKGKLRLDTEEGAAKVVDARHFEKSELLLRIVSKDPDEQMPPPDGNIGKTLTAREVEVLRAWVAAGAKYAKHWAFETPVRPSVSPEFSGMHPIDALVRARLKVEGLKPSGTASKETLVRRLYLDLTGLPPTAREVSDFVQDARKDAYERLVDRVLASPRYGERMALLWMDLARYGDSSVYHADGPREMWGWRDWVISAFNHNMPFDQFTVEQLAGDLLPNPTLSQKIATGFNRNHATTDEGGVIAEEFRVDYVVDRVKTTSNVWLGLSLECAQCHDHKYDPISQADYYRFYAYFNNTRDPGMQTRNGNTVPLVEIPDPEADAKRKMASEDVRSKRNALESARQARVKTKAFSEWANPGAGAVASSFPKQGVVFHLPCREGDKSFLLNSLQGEYVAAKGLSLMAAKRPGGGGVVLGGNLSVPWNLESKVKDSDAVSFAAWVKLPEKAGSAALLSRMEKGPGFRGFEFGFEGKKPVFQWVQELPKKALKAVALEDLSHNQWHHVVVTYDGSRKAAGVRLYVDGEAKELKPALDGLEGSSEVGGPLVFAGRGDDNRFKGEVDAVTLWNRALEGSEVGGVRGDYVDAIRATPAADRSAEESRALELAFMLYKDTSDAVLRTGYAKALEQQVKVNKGLSSVMVMEDLPAAQMRPTFVLSRGQYDAPMKDREVRPGVPAVLLPLPAEAPTNRLGLARWLVQPGHPLTARVTVNRFWQMLFGEGLVRTSEDFGLQGEMPSHSDVLDWLAVELVESGWNVKALLKRIVMSETYRQDSRVYRELQERDPDNRLLARGPRFRLQAEFIRDGALSVSGLLNPAIGGPSVKPYQPKGIWEEVALDTNLSKFTPDSGEKLYRRSMYTFWKRSSPHPSMVTFDATTREKCTGRRSRTNTPLQALVTLNDPQFVEAARAFAQRMILEGGATHAERIAFAIREAVGREPRGSEVKLLSELAERERRRFRDEPEKARQILAVGESPRNSVIPQDEHAAWMVVANTVLNLDDFLVKF